MKLIITCEHGGNIIPQQYETLFRGAEAILNSHRGYDPGALDLFSEFLQTADFERFQKVSRLLVELNRSLHHPQLFSEFTRDLSEADKKDLLKHYYFPYRNEVEAVIANYIQTGEKVVHLSIHTFTPELHGQVRKADIGLLYDPKRHLEKIFCRNLKEQLRGQDPDLRVRLNYPYRGTADGFTTYLRKKFDRNYAGIEIEVNQKYVVHSTFPASLKNTICRAIAIVIQRQNNS